jgi:hypothetical protein
MPEVLKPAPAMVAAEIVTLVVLELGLLICTIWVLATPVATVPKLMLVGDIVNEDWGVGFGVGVGAGVGAGDVPDTLMLVVPPCAFVSRMMPLLVPADAGLNLTVNATFSPGVSTTGLVTPVVEKPGAFKTILDKVRLAFPAFRKVVTPEAVVPAFTLAKLSAAGVAVNWPTGWVVASPARLIAVDGFSGSLLETATLPL